MLTHELHKRMASTTFQVFTPLFGIQATPAVTSVATAAALATTAQRASSTRAAASPGAAATSNGAILAATGSPAAGTGVAVTASLSSEDAHILQLEQQANAACFIAKDPAACSLASQTLGAATSAGFCWGGSDIDAFNARKRAGSVEAWLQNPTWVSAVKPSTKEQSSVAISLSQNKSLVIGT